MAKTALALAHVGLRDRIVDLVETSRDARGRRREYNRVYGELARMTDRDLTDIGISRGSIGDIAFEAAYGCP